MFNSIATLHYLEILAQLPASNMGNGDGRGEETSDPKGVTSLTQTLVRIPNQTQEEHIQEEGA